ncbi:Putative teichuronic acid biosynthesis glycosyltransferase TuaC [[Clostridium] hylemonae DSM 15053]|nr:glycosyltransferase [[Clostridium] hylemonae]QEK17158.1 Putative teichuronic acid biosynthesis glycosyltransferase TuaC [[Clostridium] hylemonae DSM 15053]
MSNILIIPSWYPSISYPNNGSFFKEQAETLKKAGFNVSVLCLEIPYRNTKKDYRYFRKNKYIENGITIYRYVYPFGILHRFPRLYYKFLKLASVWIFGKEFKNYGFCNIHAHSFLIGGYIGVCLSEKYGCQCVITEHSSKILRGVLNDIEKKVLRECVDKSNHFVCVSNNLKRYVEKMVDFRGKICVQPNMVSPIFKSSYKTFSPFLFTSVGNLIPGKKMDLLIEGFCECFSEKDDVILKVIGGGQERQRLEGIIKSRNRENQIILTGPLPRNKVAEILAQSNVMALVSEIETFGIAYIEALASGNVIIGAHNGGADDIITEDNGVFISEFDIASVSTALRYVHDNYNNYDCIHIRKSCIQEYGEEAFVNAYRKFWRCESNEQ